MICGCADLFFSSVTHFLLTEIHITQYYKREGGDRYIFINIFLLFFGVCVCACVHVHWGTPFSLARSFSPDSRRHVDQSENSKGEGTDGVVASIPPPPPPLIPQGRRRRRSALLFAPSRRRPPRRWPSSVATAVRDVPAFVSVSSVYRPGRCCGRGCRPNSLASGPASRASLPLTPPHLYMCIRRRPIFFFFFFTSSICPFFLFPCRRQSRTGRNLVVVVVGRSPKILKFEKSEIWRRIHF